MSTSTAFPPGTISSRPKVAFSLFTMMLGDIMRNLRVERQPKTIASPRPLNANTATATSTNVGQVQDSNNGGNPNFTSLLPESNEAVFKAMGVDVGMRTIAHISNIAITREASAGTTDPNASMGGAGGPSNNNNPVTLNRIRPSTFLEAAKFIATHCWEYWFDHQPQAKFQHLEAYYIDEYESLSCFPFSSSTGGSSGGGGGGDGGGNGAGSTSGGTVNGIQYSMFVQGMIEGAMRACGYPVLVNFSQADEGGTQQYQILPLKLPNLPQSI